MITFDNTQIAFESKSDKDLNRAYRLFKLIGNRSLVKIGKPFTNFALSIGLPIKGIIRKTIFAQFCGGETIDECDATINKLGKFGIGTILDYSVEGKTSDEDFEHTTNEIIATILKGDGNDYIPFAVFKVTGIARFELLENANNHINSLTDTEKSEYEQLLERVDRICKAGFEKQVPVFIDAEETWIQDTIDRIAYEMMLKYNKETAIIYNTVQMYRHDRLAYLKKEIEAAKKDGIKYGVKLVRGAYMEKERARAQQKGYPSPIQPDKTTCDADYNRALEFLVSEIDTIALCAGSHNENSSLLLTELMEKHSIVPSDSRIYFAQLLGMSDHISYNLSKHGFNVAKYVPYGPIKEVMPYLLRRADENTSVAGQTGRELSLIIKEKKRRKLD
ncbi:proline dehydrogenase family protein [Crocinitomicaceae bacterium CZZ-1]|uniref:Proline dehydrogenase family protein n=1 Tax=Taishania pollutisoli TaxID=2766479 RepID=A0A8J6U2S5_9FLAO|nr:proline dehydrogenase family protein [Taishania pollutisoli]MBC9813645.1 proline dehydrogenase family protein [Taishania pollutisoli]